MLPVIFAVYIGSLVVAQRTSLAHLRCAAGNNDSALKFELVTASRECA